MQVRSYISERQRARRKRRRYFFTGVGLVVFYFVALGIGWIVLRSPVFHAEKIIVQGNTTVPSDAIVSLVEAAIMPPEHRTLLIKPLLGFQNILVWPSGIPTSTLAWIPQLAGLTISKDYFSHTITITVSERQALAIWCFVPQANGDEQCFWLDETGTMFARAYDTQGGAIMVVHDYSQKPTGVNQKILPDEFVANLVSIVNAVRAANLNADTIDLNDLSLQEVDVPTINGPSVYFSLRFPADNDVPVIQGIMAQAGWNNLSYIDCRTENRVYYK